jgi:Cu(I)/Ag(I) efflux system membrane protein CusA/SilA
VADVAITDGPPMLQERERAALGLGLCRRARPRPAGWSATCSGGRQQVKLEPGVSIAYSGQFEYLERANARS